MRDTSSSSQHPRTTRSQSVLCLCATLAAVIGLAALLGWVLGFRLLATFGSGNIPMAPSTALFFLAFGAGTSLLALPSPKRPARRAGTIAGSLVTAAALLLLFLSWQGVHPQIEHLGMEIAGTLNDDSPLGHMSPLTAFCFALTGVSFLASLWSTSTRPWQAMGAFGAASLVSLISFALLLAYFLGAPLLYDSKVIPPALSTSLAFFLLGISLQLAAGLRAWPPGNRPELADPRAPYVLTLIFAFLVVGIITAGSLSFRHQEREHRTSVAQQLISVAALKADRISSWLADQQAHGEELAANREFGGWVEQWLHSGTESAREIILLRLGSQLAAHDHEGVTLLDDSARPRLSLGDPLEISPLTGLIRRARTSGEVLRSDLYRDDSGKIRLAWVVPIRTARGGQPLAIVIWHAGSERFLFPFLQHWPGATPTAEALLIRSEGDQVLFLNDLKLREDAALRLGMSRAKSRGPGGEAGQGRKGITEGLDYRGVPVVAALCAVPGSGWFLVARMDKAEIQAPLRGRLWEVIGVIFLLLLGAGVGVGLLWRRQQHAHRFALLAAAAAKERQLNIELEQRVAERTTQLEAANRELEAFSYSVSHDLKAPLRGIDGYSRLLEEDYHNRLDAEGRTFLHNIRHGVSQMYELIEDLLAYSRMERRALHHVALDVPALVKAVTAACAAEVNERGAVLRLDLPEMTVRADREGMLMVLRNLLENAIKFSRAAQPPRIEIGARAEVGKAVLWVRDNGIGFDMQFHDRLFEMFSRLERAEDFPGTGVGLALVRKAMQRMGGKVWAESAPGLGATFFLELPQ